MQSVEPNELNEHHKCSEQHAHDDDNCTARESSIHKKIVLQIIHVEDSGKTSLIAISTG